MRSELRQLFAGNFIVAIRYTHLRDYIGKKSQPIMAGQVLAIRHAELGKYWIAGQDNCWVHPSHVVPLDEHALRVLDRRRTWQLIRRFWYDGFEPNRYHTYMYLTGRAITLQYLGYLEEAIDHLTRAIALRPRWVTAYNVRSSVYCQTADYEAAIQDCNQAIKLAPHVLINFSHRACAHLYSGQLEAARRDMQHLCSHGQLGPGDHEVYGYLFLHDEVHKQALEHFDQAIAQTPGLDYGRLGRAIALRCLDQPERALAEFRSIESTHNNWNEFHLQLGYLFLQLDQLVDASDSFINALNIEPQHSHALYGSAVTSMLLRRDDKLELFLTAAKAPRRATDDTYVYAIIRGVLYCRILKQHSLEQALLDVEVDWPSEKWPSPELQFIRGQLDEEALLAAASKLSQHSDAHCCLGLHHLAHARLDDARRCFQWCLEHARSSFVEHSIARTELQHLSTNLS